MMRMAVSALDTAPCLVWEGKGRTLRRLAARLTRARIPDTAELMFGEWCAGRASLLADLAARFHGADVAVRSDHDDEDRRGQSSIGRYLSVLAVASDDAATLATAIDSVFASYGETRPRDRLLIQYFVNPIRSAAVASTHALGDGAPYYCVSMAVGPSSVAVTRGDSCVTTWYVARDSAATAELPDDVSNYLQTLRGIESLAGGEPCEAELVIDAERRVWLLQARPITIQPVRSATVSILRRKVETSLFVANGHAPLLGLMSDWNTAELLGEHPRPLAFDLFDRVIARRAWRLARVRLGYASLPGRHLLHPCAGRPYIDIDASFRSLVPIALAQTSASRLVAAWCQRLRERPELHDKIEFDVAISALGCDFDHALDERYPHALTREERERFRSALREPTRRALDHVLSESLHLTFEPLLKLPPPPSTPERLTRWCRANHEPVGIAFAMAARQAFVVEAILRSLVTVGAIDELELRRLKTTVHTVASEFRTAYAQGHEDEQSRSRLLERFGHLRAGTFEIAAPRLVDMADCLGPAQPIVATLACAMPSRAVLQRVNRALAPLDLGMDATRVFDQYSRAVRMREFGKFALSRVVSLTLDALAARAESLGVPREDAGWLRAASLLARRADAGLLREHIARARDIHRTEARLRMPQLLVRPSLAVVTFDPGCPNYVGTGCVDACVVSIAASTRPAQVPVGSIIATASADPGFEWIFLRRPVCLVTAYGGPNSHMAIRCAELGMPALLGLGPEAFRRVIASTRLAIDFDARTWSCS